MGNGARFIRNVVAPSGTKVTGADIRSFTLQPTDVFSLKALNREDCCDSFFKACISIVDGFAGLGRGLTSWAAVKLYYSTYYCAKARLEASDECHVYLNTTPYFIEARNGAALTKGKGTSHAYVFSRFKFRFPTLNSLSQPIEAIPPLDWLRRLREAVQYNDPFEDSDPPCSRWRKFGGEGVAKQIRGYLSRDALTYAFDPDHAAFAFPLLFFAETAAAFSGGARSLLTRSQLEYLEPLSRIATFRIGEIVGLMRSVM